MPRYAADFHCTGNACEDTCCAGWNIPIDKQTLKAYRHVDQPHLVDRLKQFVQLLPNAERNPCGDPARINLTVENQGCPFLEQGLCAIHRDLGEDYLSNTCATFPRRARDVAGQVEYALDLACPEAARKALLAENALDLIEAPIVIRPATVTALALQGKLSPLQINDIRGFCFQLMQAGDLLLWQRLVLIGHFCHQLDEFIAKDRTLDVPRFLVDFVKQIENGAMLETLTKTAPNHSGQAQLFFKFWQGQAERRNSPTQATVQDAVAAGLCGKAKGSDTPDWEPLIRNYQTGLQRMTIALEAAPVLLNNYLLNEMFREMFPFGSTDPYRHFLGMISRFGLLRLMLAGVCNATEAPGPDMLVRTTQVFNRLYPHPAFSSKAVLALEFLGFDKPQRFVELLHI
ncbi:MAG: flagellin lysine-N-methylase [Rhodocyclaceae bacterium]